MPLISLKEQVKKAKYFSLIADETSDISRTEQVSICLRYIKDGTIHERFFGFYDTAITTGEELAKLMVRVMKEENLVLENIVGFGFDGAMNMAGQNCGAAVKMKPDCPRSLYVHCHGHRLNLALQDALSRNILLQNTLGIFRCLFNFIKGSPKRHSGFQDILKEHLQTVVTLKTSRWISELSINSSIIFQ